MALKPKPIMKPWNEEFTHEEHVGIRTSLALGLADRIHDRELRVRLLALIHGADYESLVTFELDYRSVSVPDAIVARQVLAFFQKDASIDLGRDLRKEGLLKFEASELRCAEINEQFRLWGQGRFQFRPCVESVFHSASRKITSLLGPAPEIPDLQFKFGPGATTTTKKRNASPRHKVMDMASSLDLLPLAAEILAEMPALASLMTPPGASKVDLAVHEGKLAFVPKNATSVRAIVVEPALNTMYQGALGRAMERRLRRSTATDIRDQSKNQRLARYGSCSGALATLDLSSASDSIAYELVWHLLPFDWAELLSYGRTSTVSGRKMEKFSSMGNGFTFPLETLIFWGLCSAAVEYLGLSDFWTSVYGDDIIVPTAAYDFVVEVLWAAGFEVNRKKSFSSGRFRESCGADYLDGYDVRPVYIRDRLSHADLFRLHNFFVARHDNQTASSILSWIPKEIRLWGPAAYGDGHLHGDWRPRSLNRDRGYSGFTFETYSFKGRRSIRPFPGDYVYALYSVYAGITRERAHAKRGDGFYVDLPGVSDYKRIKIYTLCV